MKININDYLSDLIEIQNDKLPQDVLLEVIHSAIEMLKILEKRTTI